MDFGCVCTHDLQDLVWLSLSPGKNNIYVAYVCYIYVLHTNNIICNTYVTNMYLLDILHYANHMKVYVTYM